MKKIVIVGNEDCLIRFTEQLILGAPREIKKQLELTTINCQDIDPLGGIPSVGQNISEMADHIVLLYKRDYEHADPLKLLGFLMAKDFSELDPILYECTTGVLDVDFFLNRLLSETKSVILLESNGTRK